MNYEEFLGKCEDRIKKVFEFFDNHFLLSVFLFFAVSLIVRLVFTPYDALLRKDAYVYLIKAIEFSKGDILPIISRFDGWSFFLSSFITTGSLLKSMICARIVSVFIGALSIFPLAYLGRHYLKNGVYILLMLFAFSSQLIISASSALTEPIFTLLFLFSMLCLVKSDKNKNYIYLASVFASLAYYVRPNGIFVLGIILISMFLFRRKEIEYRAYIYVILIFFVVSAPFLIQRHINFGSAFFYGENSKYFVNSYEQVWSSNIPVPSLMTYLSSHGFFDYINKFFIHGFIRILFDFFYSIISPVLLFFFAYGFIKHWNKKFMLFSILSCVWIISLIPVYSIFGDFRHMLPLLPFAFLLCAQGIKDIFGENKQKNMLIALILMVFALFSIVCLIKENKVDKFGLDDKNLEWAKFIAHNLSGKIAIVEGSDLVSMYLDDRKVSGNYYFDYYSPSSGMVLLRPGYFSDFNSSIQWFKDEKFNYIVVDEKNVARRNYLKEVLLNSSKWSFLKEAYSGYDGLSGSKIKIFALNFSG